MDLSSESLMVEDSSETLLVEKSSGAFLWSSIQGLPWLTLLMEHYGAIFKGASVSDTRRYTTGRLHHHMLHNCW